MPKCKTDSLLNSYFVANLKLCFNIVRGHNGGTATKLPFKLMAIFNSSSLKQPAILKHENAMKSLSSFEQRGGSAHHTCFKAFTGVSPPILIDALFVLSSTLINLV